MRPHNLRLGALFLVFVITAGCGVGVFGHGWRGFELIGESPPSSLPVPVEGVRPSRLADSFGDPRSGGRSHAGIDIFAPRGTPVRAAVHGIITSRGNNALGGRVVHQLGPGGQRHYYAHLEGWGAAQAGDWVEAGAVIGFVGSSGNAEGGATHLHYGVYSATGEALNPFPLLTVRRPQPPGVATSANR